MSANAPSHRRGRSGHSMVEATFVLLLFLTTLIGIFDISQVLFRYHTLTNRAKAAARWGIIHPGESAAIQNVVLYGQPAAPEDGSPPHFDLTAEMVTVQRLDTDTSSDRLVVTVAGYPLQLVTPVIANVFDGPPIVVTMPVESP